MPRTQSLAFAIRRRALPLHRSSQRPISFLSHTPRQYPSSICLLTKRTFARLSPLQIVPRPTLRPQLPFLHPRRSRAHRSFLTWYLTPTRKARWKQTLRWQLRFHGYLWPTLLLVTLLLTGIRQAELERRYPTPREWAFWARWHLRNGLFDRDRAENAGGGAAGWAYIGRWYDEVLRRCEKDIESKKGKKQSVGSDGQKDPSSEGLFVEGVGELGTDDLSDMSEPWVRGYYQALMGAAKVAEHLDGYVRRKGDESSDPVPWESVTGPSNPRPKPLPWDKKGLYKNPPRDDEVEDAYSAPEKFYMRILTNREFTDRQRLDAAIAYADYLDYKGLWETAGDMYDWALDIAAGGLPTGANNVVDMKSGIINAGQEEWITENLLKASTGMGVHYARRGDVQAALPIFLSVLRARKALPPSTVEMERQRMRRQEEKRGENERGLMGILTAMKSLVFEQPYPPAPSSGNERPCHSLKEACEEVGLMTYIGEILFATSDKEKEKGLSWTRDSVGAVEAVLWVMEEKGDVEGKERCQECLQTGLENWKEMTKQMVRAANAKVTEAEHHGGWLGSGIGKGTTVLKAKEDLARWEEEEAQIELRRLKTVSLMNPLSSTGGVFNQV